MVCHIIPMAYLDGWSTEETRGKDRDKRLTYIFLKNKKIGILKKTENIKINTIAILDLYILSNEDDEKLIEEGFSKNYEQKYKRAIGRINVEENETFDLDLIIQYKCIDNQIIWVIYWEGRSNLLERH